MKKIITIFFLVLMTLTTLSCTKQFSPYSDTDDLDFSGGKVVIFEGTYLWHFPISRGETASSDRELDRYAETEKKFNLVFEYNLDKTPAPVFLAAAMSGGMQADFLYSQNNQMYDAYLINTLLPIEEMLNDPESNKWASPANNAKGFYGGKLYGFFPNYWETMPYVQGMLNINMDLLDEYDINDPYEYIESGEWNWSNFRSFLQQTTFTDGEKKWLGMGRCNTVTECYFPFILSNGGTFLKEENGRYSLNINSPAAMETYEYIADLAKNGLITDVPTDDPDYMNGAKWMVTCGAPSSSKDFNMSQIRYPYGPNGNKDTISTISLGVVLWSFPIFSAYNENEIGEVAEFMFEPLSADYPNGWKDIISENLFCYQTECDYFINSISVTEYIDRDVLEYSFDLFNQALKDIVKGNQSPNNAIDSIFDPISEEIDEKYNH